MLEKSSQVFDINKDLVCPKCKGELSKSEKCYSCEKCEIQFPILFGIADFRLRSDRYLTIEQEREKAHRLFEKSKKLSFEELLEYYYQITDDVPAELASRYTAYNLNASIQAAALVKSLSNSSNDNLLDLGCGSGGMLQAANSCYQSVVGVDIALRWLVIAKKRLDELGIEHTLICADVENLPFIEHQFDQVIAGDLLEHVYDMKKSLREMGKQLKVGGKLWISAANRYFIGPNASTRIWAIGIFPKFIRTWLLMKLRGVDSLRFINLISPLQLKKMLANDFTLYSAEPKNVVTGLTDNYPIQDKILIAIYLKLLRFKVLRLLLFVFGPAFEMTLTKK